MVWWIAAFVLSVLGFWMVQRGWCGARRVVSRTRRCPKCRYDMSAMPGEMICAECGFTARDEATWYAGRRRFGPIVVGLVLWISAIGAASWPSARVNGYLSFLPLRVQIQVWPAWLRLLDTLELDPSAEWTAVQMIPSLIQDTDSAAIRETAWRRGMQELRALPPMSESAGDVAYILTQTPIMSYTTYDPSTMIEIESSDVLFLLNHPNEFAVAAGTYLAPYCTDSGDEIFEAVLAVLGTPRDAECDAIYTLYTLDRGRDGVWTREVFATGSEREKETLAGHVAYSAWIALYPQNATGVQSTPYDDSFMREFMEHARGGDVSVRSALMSPMVQVLSWLQPQFDQEGSVTGFGQTLTSPERALEVVELFRAVMSSDDEVAVRVYPHLVQPRSNVPVRVFSVLLRRPLGDQATARILGIIESQGTAGTDALADLRVFRDDPGKPEQLRLRAGTLIESMTRSAPVSSEQIDPMDAD